MPSSIPQLPADAVLLPALLELLPSGVICYAPLLDAGGQVVDFAFQYLNPAARQLLALPEQPSVTFSQHFSHAATDGGLAFHREVYQQGGPARRDGFYRADGYEARFTQLARRVGDTLLVSFTLQGAAEQPVFDAARRAHQAQEQAQYSAVLAQRDELRRLFEQAPLAIAILRGPRLVVELANAAVGHIWGRPPAEVLGRPYFEGMPETAGQGFEEILSGVLTTGQPFFVTEAPVRLARPDAAGQPEQGFVSFGFHPLRNAHGQVAGVIAIGIEVTEQVRMREQTAQLQAELLAAAETRAQQRQNLYQVLEQAPVAIILLRAPDHRVEYFNPAYQRLFATTPTLGTPIASSQPATVRLGLVAQLDRVYQTGEPYSGAELSLAEFNPAGPERYVNFTCQAYREQGRIAGVSVFIYDETEQVLARQERRTQQQLVEAVFEQSPTALFVLQGPEFVVEVVNPLMEQMLGRPRTELLGRPYFAAMPELARQGYLEFMQQVWRSGEAVVRQEQPARLHFHQPGEQSYFTFVYQPLHDAAGQLTGIACVAVDVTAQVLARQQVQQLNEDLAAVNAELRSTNDEVQEANTRLTHINADLDTFVYTASHDLKAPITNIEGLLAVLQDEAAAGSWSDTAGHVLTLMQDAVERFRATLGHLTEVTRLQPEALPVAPINLATVVESVQLDLAPLLAVSHAQVILDTAACTDLRIPAKTLRSVIYNLLSNALKYRSPERVAEVHISCQRRERQMVLEVRDNGLGIDLARQTEIFGMFRRYHTHVEGAGVGLYMVKRMVEHANGHIQVYSQPGIGSTFTVFFPVPGGAG